MAIINADIRGNYQAHFNFLTGLSGTVVSDVSDIPKSSFEGEFRQITFNDGYSVLIQTKDTDPNIYHIYLLAPGQSPTAAGVPQSPQSIIDFGNNPDWKGDIFAADWLPHWFADNNAIGPANINPTPVISDNQVLDGWSGNDDLTGSIGDDRFVDDHGGLVRLAGGPSDGNPTGNDTFVFTAGVITQGTGARSTTIAGTDRNFFGNYTPGEINTIEAQGNNDFSFADIFRINQIVYNGATSLIFGAGQFRDSGNDGFHSFILPSVTIVGDGGVNALDLYLNPAEISTGHSSGNGSSDGDFRELQFSNWTIGQDTVTIHADLHGLAGTPKIFAPNVPTTILGGDNEEVLVGGTANDTIYGGKGDDLIYGGAGDDIASGDADNDVLVMGDGNDFAYGGAGNDYTYMGNGDDTAVGDAGIDVLLGEAGNDSLYGGDGQDYLFGGSGTNTMFGGAGVDVMISEGVNDVMYGGTETDYFYAFGTGATAFGEDGNDIFVGSSNADTFYGGDGQDYFYGQDGADVAYGGVGVDVLLGQGGNDTLYGGGGAADYLFGGTGADTFVIQNLPGANVIQDFTRAEGDLISLQATGLNSFADVLSHTSDFGSFCVVTIDADTNIWIIGQTSATLQATDFAFS